MATRSGAANSFWWALIGCLVGVSATLAAVIYLDRGDPAPGDAPPPARRLVIAPGARTAPKRAPSRPAAPAFAPRAAPAPATDSAASDEQVAEDAAAAGMTSQTPQ